MHPHCQLSLSLNRVDSVISPCDVAKMGIQDVVSDVSANFQPLLLQLAVNTCPKLCSIQSCPWNNQILSIAAGAVAGMRPMVPVFRSFIDQQRARGCSQSCMQFAQFRAQLNSVPQWAYPHPCHVKKHTGSITAACSSMGPLCTPVCSHPIKDSDSAVCCLSSTWFVRGSTKGAH